MENRLGELWSIMDFLNPGYLGPKAFFQKRFATPIERYGDTSSLRTLEVSGTALHPATAQDRPQHHSGSARKAGNGRFFCGLSAEQADLYQKIVDQSLETINEADGVQRKRANSGPAD